MTEPGSDRYVTPGAGPHFVAATEQLEGGRPLVSVIGEVDLASARAFEETLRRVAERPTGDVIVDLSGCSFFDSTGLKALLDTRVQLNRSNRPMTLVVSNPNVMKIFQITGFDTLFAMHASLGAAMNGNGNGNGNVHV